MYANKNDAYLWVSEYMKEKGAEKTNFGYRIRKRQDIYEYHLTSYSIINVRISLQIFYKKSIENIGATNNPFSFTIPASKEDFFTLLKILDK